MDSSPMSRGHPPATLLLPAARYLRQPPKEFSTAAPEALCLNHSMYSLITQRGGDHQTRHSGRPGFGGNLGSFVPILVVRSGHLGERRRNRRQCRRPRQSSTGKRRDKNPDYLCEWLLGTTNTTGDRYDTGEIAPHLDSFGARLVLIN
jgi:hypothetical protein